MWDYGGECTGAWRNQRPESGVEMFGKDGLLGAMSAVVRNCVACCGGNLEKREKNGQLD